MARPRVSAVTKRIDIVCRFLAPFLCLLDDTTDHALRVNGLEMTRGVLWVEYVSLRRQRKVYANMSRGQRADIRSVYRHCWRARADPFLTILPALAVNMPSIPATVPGVSSAPLGHMAAPTELVGARCRWTVERQRPRCSSAPMSDRSAEVLTAETPLESKQWSPCSLLC